MISELNKHRTVKPSGNYMKEFRFSRLYKCFTISAIKITFPAN
jgi:hypothetical protein